MMKLLARHNSGCKQVGFYYNAGTLPTPQDIISSDNVTLPDGSHPKCGDEMVCGHCGKAWHPDVSDVERIDKK